MSIKCTEIIFTPISSLACRVSGGTTSIIPHEVNGEILSLEMPSGNSICVGDCLKVKTEPYKINMIEKITSNNILFYKLKVADKNKSSLFILPMLDGNRHYFMYDSLLMNVFIGDDENLDCIILLYRWSMDPLFVKLERNFKNSSLFKASYNPDPYHVIFVFDIPEYHMENFNKFKKGKYSKLDDLYKLRILQFHEMDIDGVLGQILFKSRERKLLLEEKLDIELDKNAELLSILQPKDEILNLKYYLNEKS